VDYRAEMAKLRGRRDDAIARAKLDFNQQRAALVARRDAEIVRLRDEGLTLDEIPLRVGCSRGTVGEVIAGPEKRREWNERRRRYWQEYKPRRRLRAAA
jgi:hypothetical protein